MASKPADQFCRALMSTVDLPMELLDSPATIVVGRPDRADSGMALCYRAGQAAIIWTDPAVADRFGPLAAENTAVSAGTFAAHASELGMIHLADVAMRVLVADAGAEAVAPGPQPEPYEHRRLTTDDVDLVRALTDACSPEEVEAAALDDLDDLDEAAMNVLMADGVDAPVAYASASAFDWDDGIADIGVLVHPEHRRRGLGRWVVARATADLLADGRLPLYRHELTNLGSSALSAGLGFKMVAWLQAFGTAET